MTTIHIDFISDYICPWCYIGKARLERVKILLQNEIHLSIGVKPYLLYPKIPIGGLRKEVFAKKTKPGMGRSLKLEAKKEGLQINYKNIERIPNSLEAHRLTWLVKPELKYELAKRIFHDYFENGADIENHDFLIEHAKNLGVNKLTIGKFFGTNEGKDEVEVAIKKAKEDFITMVPSLKLSDKFVIPGLQSKESWINNIRRAAEIKKSESENY